MSGLPTLTAVPTSVSTVAPSSTSSITVAHTAIPTASNVPNGLLSRAAFSAHPLREAFAGLFMSSCPVVGRSGFGRPNPPRVASLPRMDVPENLLCLFTADITNRDGSFVIEIPQREVDTGEIRAGDVYRVAMLPSQTQGNPSIKSISGGYAVLFRFCPSVSRDRGLA